MAAAENVRSERPDWSKKGQAAIANMGDVQRKSTLPGMKDLALTPAAINGLLVVGFLCLKRITIAEGVLAGCVVGLLMYALLHTFVEKLSLSLFAPQGAKPDASGMAYFAVFAVGKFVVVGLAIYLFLGVLHAGIGAFIVGFAITQVSISVSVVKTLFNKRIAD